MIALTVLILCLGHAFILRMLAWPLIAADSPPQADFYCLHGGEGGADGYAPFDHAAAWYAEAPGRKILLLLPPDSRIVEIGALRSFEQMCRSELEKRHVPPSDVSCSRGAVYGAWGEAHAMADWLKGHPGASVVLACNPLISGRQKYVFDKVLGPADAARVRLTLLADSEGTVKSWWRSRSGVKDFMFSWLELVYAWAEGDDAREVPLTAAAFQSEIRAQIGEAPP
jgi:hypothetical protein